MSSSESTVLGIQIQPMDTHVMCQGLGLWVPQVDAFGETSLTTHLKWCILVYVNYTSMMLN